MQNNILQTDPELSKTVPELLEISQLDLVKEFLKNGSTRGNFSQNTVVKYQPILKEFETYCKGQWGIVRLLHVRSFIGAKTESDSLKNLHRACLSSFFAWLEANDIVSKNPCRGLAKYQEEAQGKDDYQLTEEDYQKMLLALPKNKTGDDRRFLLEFLKYTGIRKEETQTIKNVGVDFDLGAVRVLGKGNKYRWIPFPLKMRGEIKDRLLKNNGQLFKKTGHQIWYSVNRAATMAGIQGLETDRRAKKYKIHTHTLRHFFTRCSRVRGMREGVIGKILGHEPKNITGHYGTFTTEEIIEAYRGVYG